MRGKSHRILGKYLVEHYMQGVPESYQKAFLFGCIEPDRNPATYLKGSIHYQWLRGHNYRNAQQFMRHIAWHLESKQKLNLFDYYNLGKLIHYTTDAFTYAHNDMFTTDLSEHRDYEAALQDHFLNYISSNPTVTPENAHSIMEAIYSYHKEYCTLPANIHTDAKYALRACCCVLAVLFLPPIL